MKKLLFITLLGFGLSANAQEDAFLNIINNNQIIKTAYESNTLSLKEKLAVVNEQVKEGNINESQAYQIISKINESISDDTPENDESFDYNWGKQVNPFDLAMNVEMDTLVKYRSATSAYVSLGVGNLTTNGSFANSEFGYLRSNSIEWGIVTRKPFNSASNKWGIRYGLGIKYNGLATTQNKEFVVDGAQTVTQVSNKQLRKNYAYLRNTYITMPITIDFSTSTKTYNEANRKFINNSGYNFGLGGYLAYNINSKQLIRYEGADGYKFYEQLKGDWNVNDFQYGLMAYVGTDKFKVVAKYDLNPMFKNNSIDQNYWSLALHLGL